jgi:hypothetical protein
MTVQLWFTNKDKPNRAGQILRRWLQYRDMQIYSTREKNARFKILPDMATHRMFALMHSDGFTGVNVKQFIIHVIYLFTHT